MLQYELLSRLLDAHADIIRLGQLQQELMRVPQTESTKSTRKNNDLALLTATERYNRLHRQVLEAMTR